MLVCVRVYQCVCLKLSAFVHVNRTNETKTCAADMVVTAALATGKFSGNTPAAAVSFRRSTKESIQS